MNYEKLYSNITDDLVSEGYCILENAIETELSSKLLAFVKKQNGFKEAGISASNKHHLDENRRRDKILWLDEDASVQSEYLEFMSGLQNYLNRSLYLGVSYYEAHFSIYDKGDFYEKHVDAFRDSKNRVVSLVYYLNEVWKECDEGELLIYNMNDELIKTVVPRGNTLVIFLSEKFPHEVLIAKEKRYSIAGWFRVDRDISLNS